jgi:hypothetical protein
MRNNADHERLTFIEDDIRRRLADVLPLVVVDGRPFFTNRDFNPHGLLSAHYGKEQDELLDLCREAEKLRRQHELEDEDAPSALYLRACAEAVNLNDHHRLGPRRLAERILEALRVA